MGFWGPSIPNHVVCPGLDVPAGLDLAAGWSFAHGCWGFAGGLLGAAGALQRVTGFFAAGCWDFAAGVENAPGTLLVYHTWSGSYPLGNGNSRLWLESS